MQHFSNHTRRLLLKLVQLNVSFINVVENVTSKAPISSEDSFNQQSDTKNIKKLSQNINHLRVVKKNEAFENWENFNLPKASTKDIDTRS